MVTLNLIKETQEEHRERVASNYFAATRTRIVDKSKKKYNRQKFKKCVKTLDNN